MQQFIGDLIISGNASSQSVKEQQDVLHAAWGMTGGEALGLKGAQLEPLHQLGRGQDKPETSHNRQILSGAAGRRVEVRDRQEVEYELHGCTCPGCPFSTPPPSFETLKPKKSAPSLPRSDTIYHPKDFSSTPLMNLSQFLPRDDSTEPGSTTTSHVEHRSTGSSLRENKETSGQSSSLASDQSSASPPSQGSSLSHFHMFPCLCCHRSLQTCAQILRHKEGAESSFPHGHSHPHHHFHHHCTFAACLPCPPLAHSHTHSGQLSGPFPCLSCQHSFPTCAQLCHPQPGQSHTRQQEKGDRTAMTSSLLHPCMHCTASFPRPSQLLQHQRSVHSHKPAGFICTECGRAFNSHSNLRIHLNVHSGARPYSCTDCGKSFSQSGALKIHRRIHTGERPYSCAFCGRGFPHLAGVRAHQRTHTGEKPYLCNHCGKSFTQSGALKIHTRIHTGERPFICSLCDKGFSNRSGIRFHYRTVHGLTPEPGGGVRAGVSYQGLAGPASTAGRPKKDLSANMGLNTCSSPESESSAALSSRGPLDPNAAPLGPDDKSQAERASPDSNKVRLLYTCEDCGLHFKDALSRNRHQAAAHYSEDGEEGDTHEGAKDDG
ncbi:zinc finger protein 436 isoform X2 [Lampris incognitus]|nr:zinc finger protein 436 isoform X2 [Lampris incognitus]